MKAVWLKVERDLATVSDGSDDNGQRADGILARTQKEKWQGLQNHYYKNSKQLPVSRNGDLTSYGT